MRDVLISKILDSSPNGLIVFKANRDRDGKIVDFEFILLNPKAETIYGKKQEDLIGKTLYAIYPEGQSSRMFSIFERVVETGIKEEMEHYYGQEGLDLWFRISAVKMEGWDAILVVISDVTEQKKLEVFLLDTQEIAQVGSFEYDRVRDRLKGTKEYYRIMGINIPKELSLQEILVHVHPDDREKVRGCLNDSMKNKRIYKLRHRLVFPDGTEKYVWMTCKIIFNEQGEMLKSLGTMVDITHIHQIEEELIRNQEILYLSQEIAQVGSFDYDILNDKLVWSPEMYKILGYNETDVITTESFNRRIHPEDWTSVNNTINEGMKKGGPVQMEYRIVVPDNTIKHIWSKGKVFKNEEGVSVRIIGINFDITDKKLAQEELRKLNAELEERVRQRTEELQEKNEELIRINRELDTFVYSASHDLKSPINNLEGLIHTMEEDLTEENQVQLKGILEMIHKTIIKFRGIINDLASIGKAQAGGEAATELFFEDVLAEVKMLLASEIEASRAVFIEDLSKPETVVFTRKHLRSILQNLISNAIKYRSPSRRLEIKISTAFSDGYILVIVSDNGLGIKEKDKDKIFNMYQRLHNHVEGSGVGMAIVARVVDSHGGRIEVDSQEGVGTTFRIYIKPEVK